MQTLAMFMPNPLSDHPDVREYDRESKAQRRGNNVLKMNKVRARMSTQNVIDVLNCPFA